jgi:hypothetical protein
VFCFRWSLTGTIGGRRHGKAKRRLLTRSSRKESASYSIPLGSLALASDPQASPPPQAHQWTGGENTNRGAAGQIDLWVYPYGGAPGGNVKARSKIRAIPLFPCRGQGGQNGNKKSLAKAWDSI